MLLRSAREVGRNAVASSSKLVQPRSAAATRQSLSGRRHLPIVRHNSVASVPLQPRQDEAEAQRSNRPMSSKDIKYDSGGVPVTRELLAFLDGGTNRADGMDTDEAGWAVGDGINEIGPGRIVECRRENQTAIGLILGSVLVTGRPRLIILTGLGAVVALAAHDVQYIMPSSLVSPELAAACWSPDLLRALAEQQQLSSLSEVAPEILAAMREVTMVIRKVIRETEKMEGKLLRGLFQENQEGGMQAVWERWAPKNPEERSVITAVEAAEFLLNTGVNGDPISVEANTLPAYAAHTLLMKRPDLFTSDPGDMWQSGTFLVRSRVERARFADIRQLYDSIDTDVAARDVVDAFSSKARAAVKLAASHGSDASDPNATGKHDHLSSTEWTDTELDIIKILMSRLYELRSTQASPLISLAVTIAKAVDPYPGHVVDQLLIERLLRDLGIVSPWNSLEASRIREAESRNIAMSGSSLNFSQDLLEGHELDALREDFTHHKVFVIDDATAVELDDGIALESIEGSDDHWIHVHVADPTRYIHPDHPAARRAAFRGSSLYLPEVTRPLFSLDIIMRELSLGAKPEEYEGRQAVMTFSARLSTDGSVSDEKVRMGWIKDPLLVTYEAVNEGLGVTLPMMRRPYGEVIRRKRESAIVTTPLSAADRADLIQLQQLARRYRLHRLRDAGFDWNQPSASISLVNKSPVDLPDNDFDFTSLARRTHSHAELPLLSYGVHPVPEQQVIGSHQVIAEFMILAGRVAASFTHSRSLPVPYKGTSAPQSIVIAGKQTTTVEQLLTRRSELGYCDNTTMLRANMHLAGGTTTPYPVPQWYMGFSKPDHGYLRVTSPLRRYEDLVTHWQIKSSLAKEKGLSSPYPVFDADEVLALARRSDRGSKTAKRATVNATKWWARGILQARQTGSLSPAYSRTPDMIDLNRPLYATIASPPIPLATEVGVDSYRALLTDLGVTGFVIAKRGTNLQPGDLCTMQLRPHSHTDTDPTGDFIEQIA